MKRLRLAVFAAFAVGAAWFWVPEDVVRDDSGPSPTTVVAVPQATSLRARSTAAVDVARVTTKRKVDARQRDAYLRRIADGVARRDGSKDEPDTANDTPDSAYRDSGSREQPNDQPHPIKDRSDGELGDLTEAVSKDLMPLAVECYEAAAERDPSVAGMIDISLEIVGDEDVGGIVESFELGDDNEIEDQQMIECIRETTLSTLFPAPDRTGRRSARLTLRFDPDPPQ